MTGAAPYLFSLPLLLATLAMTPVFTTLPSRRTAVVAVVKR